MSVSFRLACPGFIAFAISEFCTEYCNNLLPKGRLSEEERSALEKYCHDDGIFSMTMGCGKALRDHLAESISKHIGETSVEARLIVDCFSPILKALDKQITRAGSYRPTKVKFPKYGDTHISGYCSGHIGADQIDCESCNECFLQCHEHRMRICDHDDCLCHTYFGCDEFCHDCQRYKRNFCPCQDIDEEEAKTKIELLKAKRREFST